MGSWLQAVAVILINLVTAAFLAGTVFHSNKEHERRLGELDESQESQWEAIGDLRVDMGRVKTKVGIED